MKINVYAIIPAEIRYHKDLLDKAKLLYAEITAGCNYEGKCEEDNEYFAKALNCDVRTVYRHLKQLEELGFIHRAKKYIYLPNGIEKRIKTLSGTDDQPALKYDEETVQFFNDFLSKFERGVGTRINKKDLYYDTLADRMGTFSRNELIQSLDNRLKFLQTSDWHQLPENKASTSDVTLLIRDNATILKWLNTQVEEPVKTKAFKFS